MTPTAAMRARTAELHRVAETTGVVRAVIGGDVTLPRYALYLRNLLPAYEAMEGALSGGLRRPEVFRSDALRGDLAHLSGADWEAALPLVPEATRYRECIELAASSGARLAAHAYTRYLGDLMGGQVLARRLGQRLGLGTEGLAFYRFSVSDLRAFAGEYRLAIDEAIVATGAVDDAVEEAAVAFELNIALSQAVERST
ncbi:MAG: biliverdin-producing heme oxygenase [Myxococcaceae bacterium]|nr:biliverdin-producing heme oxygenase [Myxococcaceae bacterium]